ncbi:hypothetical protein [Pedobacter frigoris]|uniref:Crp/Fnr family transcriptional regulator n=1 Tax=Pedobacter frigoris TaxID=2571272 RepID=UPI00292FAA56|nr:hypothetical protein [Pedobacter frigoris]
MSYKEKFLIANNLIGTPEGNLLENLGGLMDLTDGFYSGILPMLKHQSSCKVLKVANAGDICKTAYWIDSGYGRFYRVVYQDGVRTEVTFKFFMPGSIMVIPECFFNGQPCDYYADFTKNAVVIPFTADNFSTLKLTASEAEELANKVLSLSNPGSNKKNEMLNLKPTPRYEKFLEVFGKESTRYCKVKDIASFLLIVPQTLSKIRARIKRRG